MNDISQTDNRSRRRVPLKGTVHPTHLLKNKLMLLYSYFIANFRPTISNRRAGRIMNKLAVLLSILCTVLLLSCSSLTLENVNYGWPVESVTTVSPENIV